MSSQEYGNLELRLNYVYRRTWEKKVFHGVRSTAVSCWLVESGVVRVRSPRFPAVTAAAGHWICLFPGLPRDQFLEEGVRLFSVNFTAAWRPMGQPLFGNLPPLVFPAAAGIADGLSAAGEALLAAANAAPPDARSPTSQTTLHDFVRRNAALHSWFAAWLEAMERRGLVPATPLAIEPRLRQVLDRLPQLPYSQRLPHELFRRLSGLSRPQLDRLSRRHLGRGLKEVADRLWLERAQLALAEGRSGKETAALLGFPRPCAFFTWYKRLTGHPPGRAKTPQP